MKTRESKCGRCPWVNSNDYDLHSLEKLTIQQRISFNEYLQSDRSEDPICLAELNGMNPRRCKQ